MALLTLLFLLLCLEVSVAQIPYNEPDRYPMYDDNQDDDIFAPRNVPDSYPMHHDDEDDDVLVPRNVLDRHPRHHSGQDDDVRAPRNTSDDVLAFSARLWDTKVVAPGGTIAFDRVFTNVGGLYFNTTGQFGCPDGLYVFMWSLWKGSSAELPGMRCIGSLRDGGIDLKYGPKTSYYNVGFSGITEMTAVHQCSSNPPTAVTIASMPWTEGITANSVYHPQSSFSGFRLQEGVAFTAESSEDQYLFPKSRIRIDNVLSNYGGFYDKTHSYFRCPDDGVYVFTITTHTSDPSTPWSVSRLMMEGEVLMQGPVTYNATEEYDSGSASSTTVLQCTAGLSVYVEAQSAHDFPHNSYAAELTSFTGFKLYNVSPEAVAFTAVLTQNFTGARADEPIPYDHVITNIGNAFNVSANRFVCPDDAYYLFTMNAVTCVDAFAEMHLFMDDLLINRLRTTRPSGSDDTSGTGSQSVILQCEAGSVLQTVTQFADQLFLGGFTSFSGYRMPG